jgi:hypothetical protein
MGMKLIDVVGALVSFDRQNTIYASESWTPDCEATVAPESAMPPVKLERLKMKYFLEVFIARDVLDDWTVSVESPLLRESCARLIHYAIYDA